VGEQCYAVECRPGRGGLIAHQRLARTNARVLLRVECGMMPSQNQHAGRAHGPCG
jgi:hypothetical protein